MAQIRESNESDGSADMLSLHIQAWLKEIHIEDLFVTCLSCKNLGENGTSCQLYPGFPIPVHIALRGCEKHVDVDARPPRGTLDDDIPF